MHIREHHETDTPELSQLLTAISSFHADLAPDRYQNSDSAFNRSYIETFSTSPDRTILVVEDHQTALLAACFISIRLHEPGGPIRTDKCGTIETLIVAETQRSSGIGSTLMQAAETYCLAKGCTAIKLNVACENAGAQHFYQKCGYSESDIRYFKRLDQAPHSGQEHAEKNAKGHAKEHS